MIDPRFASSTADFEDRLNRKPCTTTFHFHETPDGDSGCDMGSDGYHFTVNYPRLGAALHSVTWIVCALEARCTAFEQVDFEYQHEGNVRATFYVGKNTFLDEGLRRFIDEASHHPRIPPFEWAYGVVPWASGVAAAAIEDPHRFDTVGKQIRGILLAKNPTYLPDICVPCGSGAPEELDHLDRGLITSILHRLRTGLLRRTVLNSGG